MSTDKKDTSPYLIDETILMARLRRELEQKGNGQFALVNTRPHKEPDESLAPEGELQNAIAQHPYLEAQRFDGISPNLNPDPPLNSEARRELDNKHREQEKEKQYRLGHMPKFSNTPTPRPS